MPQDHLKHKVFTRGRWSGEWIERPAVFCDQLAWQLSPGVGRARLTHRFGRVRRHQSKTFREHEPLDLLDHYVKVEIPQPGGKQTWTGQIKRVDHNLHGGSTHQGTQTMQALEITHLLAREVLRRSQVEVSGSSSSAGSRTVEIGRAIGFNLGAGNPRDNLPVPNRTRIGGGEDRYVFGTLIEGTLPGSEWTSATILEYLLTAYPPGGLTWRIFIPPGDPLRHEKPRLHVEGWTVKQVMDTLIDRRRLRSYAVDLLGDELHVRLVNFTRNTVTVGEGVTLPANPPAADWDLRDKPTVRQVSVARDSMHQFDRIEVRGERLGYLFSVGHLLKNLETDWSGVRQRQYNEGNPEVVDEEGKRIERREVWRAHQRFRSAVRLADVYSRFKIPDDWDGNTLEEGPVIASQGGKNVDNFWRPGLRLVEHLPFEVGDSVDGRRLDRPFALIRDGESSTDPWTWLDVPDVGDSDATAEDGGRDWAAGLQMLTDEFGFYVVVAGKSQHVIAREEFEAADSDDEEDPAGRPRLSWKDIIATVFAEGDSYLTATYNKPTATTPRGGGGTLVIRVPGARLDWVADSTVIGIRDDGNLNLVGSHYQNDDRDLLERIARLAGRWYTTPRAAARIVIREPSLPYALGTMLTTINAGQENINSPITQLAVDTLAGTWTVQTGYAELDAAGVVRAIR